MDSDILIHLQNKVAELNRENQFLKYQVENLRFLLENEKNNGKH